MHCISPPNVVWAQRVVPLSHTPDTQFAFVMVNQQALVGCCSLPSDMEASSIGIRANDVDDGDSLSLSLMKSVRLSTTSVIIEKEELGRGFGAVVLAGKFCGIDVACKGRHSLLSESAWTTTEGTPAEIVDVKATKSELW